MAVLFSCPFLSATLINAACTTVADCNAQISTINKDIETIDLTYKTKVADDNKQIEVLKQDLSAISIQHTKDRRVKLDLRDPLVVQRDALKTGAGSCQDAKKAVFLAQKNIADRKQKLSQDKTVKRKTFSEGPSASYHSTTDGPRTTYVNAKQVYETVAVADQGDILNKTAAYNQCKSDAGINYDPASADATLSCNDQRNALATAKAMLATHKQTYAVAKNVFDQINVPAKITYDTALSVLNKDLAGLDTAYSSDMNTAGSGLLDLLQAKQQAQKDACGY